MPSAFLILLCTTQMNTAITKGEARLEDFTLKQRQQDGSWAVATALSVEQSDTSVNPGTVAMVLSEPLLVGQRIEVTYTCPDDSSRVLGTNTTWE